MRYEIPFDKIVYFFEAIEDPQKLIDTIESTATASLTAWEPWYAYGGSTQHIYGDIKHMRSGLSSSDVDPKERDQSSYVFNTLVTAMSNCAAKYAEIFDINPEMLEYATRALNSPETTYGINKYLQGESMGPHVDWNEFNFDITYTIVVYLNEDYEGGELHFVDPNISLKIKPKAGSIIMFPSNMPYLHESLEVIEGRKMLITHHWKNNSLHEEREARRGDQ